MNCIFKTNRASGFADEHTNFCGYVRHGQVACEETTTHHATVGGTKERPNGYWCANVCKACADYLKAKRRDVEIVEGTFTPEAIAA